jgi:hypothetical protein
MASPPHIFYTASTSKEDSPKDYTEFSILLNGSQSLGSRRPISINLPCHFEPHPPIKTAGTVKIIREMYRENSPIIGGISGNMDCSAIMLVTGDADTHTLLCEISFQLYFWEAMGQHLHLSEHDVEVIKCEYHGKFQERAFRMLFKWLESTNTPTLKGIIDGLNHCQSRLILSTWTITYNTVTHGLNDMISVRLGYHIQCHWKFISRLLGEPESTIQAVIIDERDYPIENQACKMINQWKKRLIDGPKRYPGQLTTMDVFNAIHCVNEHIYHLSLENALKLFI